MMTEVSDTVNSAAFLFFFFDFESMRLKTKVI